VDTLLRGGLVVNPETRHESVADVLVHDGKVKAVAENLTPGHDTTVLDVTGLIVGPGFIDVHSHVNSVAGQRLQAMDGVTTALELESGLMPIERAYADAAQAGRPLHYGFSASWAAARGAVLADFEPDADLVGLLALLGNRAWQGPSTPAQVRSWLGLLERELDAGALGIGILLGYAPRNDPAEFLAVAQLAATAGVPTFTHVRELVEALEVLAGPKLAKAMAFLGQAAGRQVRTNNHVERLNRRLRFAEKVRYRWRKRKWVVRWVVLLLDVAWQQAAATTGAGKGAKQLGERSPPQANARGKKKVA